MKVSAFRSFLFGCFSMVAVVFGYTAPASADYVLVIQAEDVLCDDLVPIQLADAVLTERNAQVALVRSVAELGPIHPIYQLSWRTAGHSLTDYHLRC